MKRTLYMQETAKRDCRGLPDVLILDVYPCLG